MSAAAAIPFPTSGWKVKQCFSKIPHEYFDEWRPFFSSLAHFMLGVIMRETTGRDQSHAGLSMWDWKRRTEASESAIHRALDELMPRDPNTGERTFVKGVRVDRDEGGRGRGGAGLKPLYTWEVAVVREYVRCRRAERAEQHSPEPASQVRIPSAVRPARKGPTSDTLLAQKRGSHRRYPL